MNIQRSGLVIRPLLDQEVLLELVVCCKSAVIKPVHRFPQIASGNRSRPSNASLEHREVLTAFLPQQVERAAFPAELAMNRRPVGQAARQFPRSGRRIQPCLERCVVGLKFRRQRVTQPGQFHAAKIKPHRSRRCADGAGNLPLTAVAFEMQPQIFPFFRIVNLVFAIRHSRQNTKRAGR